MILPAGVEVREGLSYHMRTSAQQSGVGVDCKSAPTSLQEGWDSSYSLCRGREGSRLCEAGGEAVVLVVQCYRGFQFQALLLTVPAAQKTQVAGSGRILPAM